MCADCEKSIPNQIVFDKIELIIRQMQDEQTGLPVKTAKSFMTKIPSVFTGIDLIQWMMKNLNLEDQQEAMHLANLIASHGYIFPIEDHTLSIKNDTTFYRFQTPYLWPSNNIDPENTDYAVYLCKRTMQGKARLELADYEAENLARLQKMFSRKWEFIFMQAESQAKMNKKRDKLERKVLDSQERAFWDVYRPVPGCVNTTELDIKKACRLSKSAKRCAECQKLVPLSQTSFSGNQLRTSTSSSMRSSSSSISSNNNPPEARPATTGNQSVFNTQPTKIHFEPSIIKKPEATPAKPQQLMDPPKTILKTTTRVTDNLGDEKNMGDHSARKLTVKDETATSKREVHKSSISTLEGQGTISRDDDTTERSTSLDVNDSKGGAEERVLMGEKLDDGPKGTKHDESKMTEKKDSSVAVGTKDESEAVAQSETETEATNKHHHQAGQRGHHHHHHHHHHHPHHPHHHHHHFHHHHHHRSCPHHQRQQTQSASSEHQSSAGPGDQPSDSAGKLAKRSSVRSRKCHNTTSVSTNQLSTGDNTVDHHVSCRRKSESCYRISPPTSACQHENRRSKQLSDDTKVEQKIGAATSQDDAGNASSTHERKTPVPDGSKEHEKLKKSDSACCPNPSLSTETVEQQTKSERNDTSEHPISKIEGSPKEDTKHLTAGHLASKATGTTDQLTPCTRKSSLGFIRPQSVDQVQIHINKQQVAPGSHGSTQAAHHSHLKSTQSVCVPSLGGDSDNPVEQQDISELERELDSLRLRLDRGGVKMSKVTQSYLSYFKQWAEYDPFIVQPIPSNPWQSDSTELWDSERQTKDVHSRRVRRWAFSLKELLNDPAGREQFYRFLEKEFSAENLKFWDAVQELKRVHSRDVARQVEAIWTEYLAQDANCPINIDSKSYETSKKNMAKKKNNRYIFDEAAGHVYQLMKNDSYPRYLRSDMYKDYKEASEKRRPNQVAFDVFKPQITTLKHKFNF